MCLPETLWKFRCDFPCFPVARLLNNICKNHHFLLPSLVANLSDKESYEWCSCSSLNWLSIMLVFTKLLLMPVSQLLSFFFYGDAKKWTLQHMVSRHVLVIDIEIIVWQYGIADRYWKTLESEKLMMLCNLEAALLQEKMYMEPQDRVL